MSPRIVAVFGATGCQGSAIVKALLADGTFSPRAITRNPGSEKARKIKDLGVEVVQADLWDKMSLKAALKNCEAVFGVTDYYDPKNLSQGHTSEMQLGKNLVDAAKETGVRFFVWSSLPNSTRISNGKYASVHHFDNKAFVEEYLKESGLPNATLHTGWFCENLWHIDALTPSSDSASYNVTVANYDPKSPQYYTWVERDLAQCVLALLKNYETRKDEIWNQTFVAVTGKMSYKEFTSLLSEVFDKPVTLLTPPTSGMPEIDEMYAFQSEFGLYPHIEIPDPRLVRLGVKFEAMRSFAEYAKTRLSI